MEKEYQNKYRIWNRNQSGERVPNHNWVRGHVHLVLLLVLCLLLATQLHSPPNGLRHSAARCVTDPFRAPRRLPDGVQDELEF